MLVLASASPRRQDLLRNAGIAFIVQPADIDETPRAGELPLAYSARMAREKALAVSKVRPEDHVLGADTIVVVDEAILGKPRDADDAMRMLRLLSGRTHQVITAVCLVSPVASSQWAVASESRGNLRTDSEITVVSMSPWSDEQIHAYIATGEPMDKAGAYAIQGGAASWIPRIEGDYSNVVGLPLELVRRMLRECGAV